MTEFESAAPEQTSVLSDCEVAGQFFEQYKLATEMADRISNRRMLVNSFFATAIAGLITLMANSTRSWSVASAGIILSIVWWGLLKRYRDLNAAKFKVILAMESRLPCRVFGDEWDILKQDVVKFAFKPNILRSWMFQYKELSQVERIVPWLYVAIFVAILVF